MFRTSNFILPSNYFALRIISSVTINVITERPNTATRKCIVCLMKLSYSYNDDSVMVLGSAPKMNSALNTLNNIEMNCSVCNDFIIIKYVPKDRILISDYQLKYWIDRNKMRCKFILIYRHTIALSASGVHEVEAMEVILFENVEPSPTNPSSHIVGIPHIAFVDYAALWFNLHCFIF